MSNWTEDDTRVTWRTPRRALLIVFAGSLVAWCAGVAAVYYGARFMVGDL